MSSDLSLAQKLLELVLGQQAMVLDKGRHLWRTLRLIVDGAVNLHVAVKDGQEVLLALPGRDVTHPDDGMPTVVNKPRCLILLCS